MNELTIDHVLKRHDMTRMALLRQLNNEGYSIGKCSMRNLAEKNQCPRRAPAAAVRNALGHLLGSSIKEEELDTIFKHQPNGGTSNVDISQPVYGVIEQLQINDLSQMQVINALKHDGITLSPTAMSQILRHGIWPKTVKRVDIEMSINAWLAQFVSKKQLNDMWKVRGATVNANPKKSLTPLDNVALKSRITFEQPEPEMLNQTTLRHFKLTRHPFENEIRTEADLFMSEQQMMLREAMVQASIGGSILAIIGECGSGKTEIRKGCLEYLRRHHPEVIVIEPMVINKKRLTAEMIFDALAEELMLTSLPGSLERRARKVESALKRSVKAGNRHVLIIEEAHDLSNDVVKYLKRIWELSDGFNRLISIILVGQPELSQKLAPSNYEVREFSRRCNVMKVPPLGRSLTDYIAHKFNRCSVDYLNVIEPLAIEALQLRLQAKVSYGMAAKASEHQDMSYPLIVNNWLVCAMNLAANLGETPISADVIKELK
ncbi:AAA family ATPase [Shewanella sp. D64]|uniref:ExeA family protein n=1 Tax=unclassified Shewanella TaxID=196818 RepID=UPI0022BA2AB7|nr:MULTISPECIES: AAA family ATPase [unclassified Shewanella]MEC4724547.1 AAA family ATPase [Shewanella sp. D64]MEC4736676.1 AAA family ATPase [Shewanella sp. E94]WBJ94654.1 AAA family ATPase [Shewanella sp. MTB7]